MADWEYRLDNPMDMLRYESPVQTNDMLTDGCLVPMELARRRRRQWAPCDEEVG